MALRTASMGSLLQGVSQQPDRIRLEGQVSVQENLISDVTLGLSTRPGTNWVGELAGAAGMEFKYRDLAFDGQDYIVGWRNGVLRMWTPTGTVVPVTVPSDAVPYLGADMRFHVIDFEDETKYILCLNRDQIVRRMGNEPPTNGHYAIFHALGGQFLFTYAITVSFVGGPTISVTYTAPDGKDDGDAAKTTSEYIAEQLAAALLAAPNLPSGTNVQRKSDVVSIWHPTMDMSIGTSDGAGGEILRSLSSTVKSVVDLPRFAANGMVVKVTTSEADEDDFYLKFVGKGVASEAGQSGFGTEGAWVEWYATNEPRSWDLTTMPHVLEKQGNGSFLMRQSPWIGRPVGDEKSSPFASILGKRIRDVNGFESRICLLTSSTVVMTRTNEPFDLWRGSATSVVATDPIDITSTKKNDLILDWLIPFDRDMFIMADPGDSQFVIRGGGLDPNTASMVLTTEFEIASGGVPPVSTGRTILFPFRAGEFSGVKEFYTATTNSAQAANSLTEGVSRYIRGPVNLMVVSQNFNFAIFRADDQKVLYIYKFLWDGSEMVQSSWSQWRFEWDVEYVYFDNSRVNIIHEDPTGRKILVWLDLNRPVGVHGYHESIDLRQVRTANELLRVQLPYAGAKFIQHIGAPYPGMEIEPISSTQNSPTSWTYEFDTFQLGQGAQVICGLPLNWKLSPSQPFATDHRDRVDTSRLITVQEYTVAVSQSGEFYALMANKYTEDYTHEFWEFYFDNEPDLPTTTSLYDGEVTVPWGERAEWSSLTLYGNDVKPVTILEVKWTGQILNSRGTTV